MDSRSLQALESATRKFLTQLQVKAPPLPKKRHKDDYWPERLGRYELSRTKSPYWPFLLHLASQPKYVFANGDMYDWARGNKTRSGYFGNVFELTTKRAVARSYSWNEERGCWQLKPGKQLQCGICTRTGNVRNTVLGYRCQYCRGSDSRHMGLIRRLGHAPIHNGRPITNYLVD